MSDADDDDSLEGIASLVFHPVAGIDSEPDWSRFAPDMQIFHKWAWRILQKTKPELVALAATLDDEAGMALLDGFTDAIDQYKAEVAILESALSRLMTAAAVCTVQNRTVN